MPDYVLKIMTFFDKNTFDDLLSIFNKDNLTVEEVFDDELQTSGGI